jgi:hypothetical protein
MSTVIVRATSSGQLLGREAYERQQVDAGSWAVFCNRNLDGLEHQLRVAAMRGDGPEVDRLAREVETAHTVKDRANAVLRGVKLVLQAYAGALPAPRRRRPPVPIAPRRRRPPVPIAPRRRLLPSVKL